MKMNNKLRLILKLINIKDELENVGEDKLKKEIDNVIKELEKVEK